MKLVKACIAMAAFAAIFVLPSISSASPVLTHPTGTAAPAGTLITATNVEHSATKTQTVMTTSVGEVVCGKATITGKVITNSGTHIEGEITTAEFAGTHGVTTTGHCKGTGLLGEKVTPTPSHTSDEKKSLPWCITASGSKDEFTLRGGKCSEAARPLTFTLHGNLTCGYEKASVTGTYTTHPNDAILTINKQVFTRMPGESAFCPFEGALDMAFTLGTDPDDTIPLYIS